MISGALSRYPRGSDSSAIGAEIVAGTSTSNTTTDTKTCATASWWRRLLWPSSPSPPRSSEKSTTSRRRRCHLDVARRLAMATTACVWLADTVRLGANGQPVTYMTAVEWKNFLSGGDEGNASWFARWNAMTQPRISQLAFRVERKAAHENEGGGNGTSFGGDKNESGPFRLSMVGDSTMMHQFGLMCAFLGERAGRRFDPAVHQKECCIDTLMLDVNSVDPSEYDGSNTSTSTSTSLDKDPRLSVGDAGVNAKAKGGRGLCVRHVFEVYAAQLDWESELGSPDVVYFGAGLHLLHMKRPRTDVIPEAVKGWLTYEDDLENVVEKYRAQGGDGFRVIFMTTHTVQDAVYEGEFKRVVDAYRNNDTEVISICEHQVHRVAGHSVGPEGFHADTYCRRALLDRNGSEILNRRARPVMDRLGVPLVESDLIVKDQTWATAREDGRHFEMLVPVEIWELLGVLVSPFKDGVAL